MCYQPLRSWLISIASLRDSAVFRRATAAEMRPIGTVFGFHGLISMTMDGSSMTMDGSSMVIDGASMTLGGASLVKDEPSWFMDGSSLVKDGASWFMDGASLVKDEPSLIVDGSSLVKDGAFLVMEMAGLSHFLRFWIKNAAPHVGSYGFAMGSRCPGCRFRRRAGRRRGGVTAGVTFRRDEFHESHFNKIKNQGLVELVPPKDS